MTQLLERIVSWARSVAGSPSPMPQPDDAGMSGGAGDATSDSGGGASVFGSLTEAEVEARIDAATRKLSELEAFEDTSAVPMRHLSDEQLALRIRKVESELNELGDDSTVGDLEHAADCQLVLRHLEVLDYLIEHPDASIPPNWVLEDERSQWAERLLSDESTPLSSDD